MERRASPGRPGPRLRGVLQFAVMTGEGFVRDHLLLRASALSYFTVLSLIPLLAVVISIVGSVGIGGDFADKIVGQIAAGNPEAQARILERIRGVNFAGLGTLGAVALLVTTVLGISNVERDLNAIWGVRQQRTLARRFADYLAVLVVAPLLLAAALSLATTLQSQWLGAEAARVSGSSRCSTTSACNRPRRWCSRPPSPSSTGSFPTRRCVRSPRFSAASWRACWSCWRRRVYLGLIVGSARYDALFGGFAALPLLFVWIYLFWAIVLFGAEVAFAYDNLPLYRREVRGRAASPAEREAIGLRIALEVARAFRDRRAGVDRRRALRGARRAGAHGARRARGPRAGRGGGGPRRRREGGRLPARASGRAASP